LIYFVEILKKSLYKRITGLSGFRQSKPQYPDVIPVLMQWSV